MYGGFVSNNTSYYRCSDCWRFFYILFDNSSLSRKKVGITVVDKRITVFQGFNTFRSKFTTVKHYTVDCLYAGSSKIRTLRCSFSVYEKLKLNKSYAVTVKMSEIIKLH